MGQLYGSDAGVLAKSPPKTEIDPNALEEGRTGEPIRHSHPSGSDTTIPTTDLTIKTSTRMEIHTISLDVPIDVAAEVRIDGEVWLESPGDEALDETYEDLRISVDSDIETIYTNDSGADQNARVLYLGNPRGVFGTRRG